jgi:hypothetical protein
MNHTAENTEIGMSLFIDGAYQIYRFKAGKTIDEIGAVKPFPALDGGGCYNMHKLLMR